MPDPIEDRSSHPCKIAQKQRNRPALQGRNNLATTYLQAGRAAEAVALLEPTLEQLDSRLGPDHRDTMSTRNNLAVAYIAGDRAGEAVALLEPTVRAPESRLGSSHPQTVNARGLLALAYDAVGRVARSEPLYRDALERARALFGPDDLRTARALAALGKNLLAQSKWHEAEATLRACLAVREEMQPDAWDTFNARSLLGGVLLGHGKPAEAEPLIISGYEGMKARETTIPPLGRPRLSEAAVRVVRLYEAWGKIELASDWKRKVGLADLPADVFARP